MRTRRSCLVLALLMVPAGAWADRHNWEVNASMSVSPGSELWGGRLGVEKSTSYRKLTYFAEIAGQGGAHEGGPLKEFSGMAGVRWVFKRFYKREIKQIAPPEHPEFRHALQFFIQGRGGVVDTESNTGGGAGGGVGADVLFTDYGGIRVQADGVRLFKDHGADARNHFIRFSLGVVYRFENVKKENQKTEKGKGKGKGKGKR